MVVQKKILYENGFKNIIIIQKDINLKNDINKTKKIIKNKKIDLLIHDVYKVKNEYLKHIKKYTKTILITDLKKFKYSADLVINGFIGFKNQRIFKNCEPFLKPALNRRNPNSARPLKVLKVLKLLYLSNIFCKNFQIFLRSIITYLIMM